MWKRQKRNNQMTGLSSVILIMIMLIRTSKTGKTDLWRWAVEGSWSVEWELTGRESGKLASRFHVFTGVMIIAVYI